MPTVSNPLCPILTRQSTLVIDSLGSTGSLIDWILSRAVLPLISALGILTLLLIFYLIFRKKIIGVSVLAVFWTLFLTLPYLFNRGIVAFLIQSVVIAGFVFVYARFGLLTIIASLTATYIANAQPITFDPARPYFGQSLVTMALIAALGCYAFYISLGKQKLFGGKGIEELTG